MESGLDASELVIVGVDAARCTFPLRHPLNFGRVVYSERDYALLRIRTAENVVGYAAAMTRGAPLLEALRPLAELIVAQDPLTARQRVGEFRRSNVPGHAALVRAFSLVDIGLWDLLARGAGVPFHRLLGRASRGRVGALAVAGYLIDVRGEDAVLDELVRLEGEGFRHVKVMLGAREPNWTHRFLARCREAMAGGTSLALDLVSGLSSFAEAVELCGPLDELDLAFVEDPFPPWQWRDLRALSEAIETPLAAGEDVTAPASYADVLEGAAVLRVDPTTCGGIEDAVAGIRLAQDAGKSAFPHGTPRINAGLAATHDAVEWVEVTAPLDTGDRFAELCQEASVVLDQGAVVVAQSPGVDVPLDWGHVTELAVAGWSISQSDA